MLIDTEEKKKKICWPINEEEQGKGEIVQIETWQSQYSI